VDRERDPPRHIEAHCRRRDRAVRVAQRRPPAHPRAGQRPGVAARLAARAAHRHRPGQYAGTPRTTLRGRRILAGDRAGRAARHLRRPHVPLSRRVNWREDIGMDSLRTIVVDDEKPARMRLIELLKREPDVDLVGTAADGREALDLLRRLKPDLLFLDVQMPQLDGFGVLEQLEPDEMPITILVTAYDKYAIQAFDAHAIDYLLKPFSDQRFDNALRRARRYLTSADARIRADELTSAALVRRAL